MRRRTTHVLLMLLVVVFAGTTSAEAKSPRPRRHWVASFAAPAQSQIPDVQPPPAAASVRSIAHASIGGGAVRIRLSNAAPGGPDLHAGSVSIGKQRDPGSPAVVPGTSHTVRFAGQTSVTIPAGTDFVYSDPVPMAVAAGDNLAVTLFLPEESNPSATAATWSTGFRTLDDGGDATADEDGSAFPLRFNGGYALTGVDVLTTEAAGAIVGWGSSTFEGWGSTRDGYDRVLDQLALRAGREVPSLQRLSVVSAGVGGDSTATGLSRLERDVFSHTGVKAMMLYNINDTGWQSRRTAAQVQVDYRTIVDAAHARGIRVYCPTWGPGAQQLARTERYEVNRWLLSDEQPCDGVVDWASALAAAPHGAGWSPLYDLYQPQFIADGIHPNPAGHAALAGATPRDWLTVQRP